MRGVNAYLFRYRDKLPADLAQSGYKPEYWKPEDSALLFCLLNFSQSSNLRELSSLVLKRSASTNSPGSQAHRTNPSRWQKPTSSKAST